MARPSDIRRLRKQGFKWDAISLILGISRQRAHQLATRKPPKKQPPPLGKQKYAGRYPGIQQISDEAYDVLNSGQEPTEEMERQEAERISEAKKQLFARHLAELAKQ